MGGFRRRAPAKALCALVGVVLAPIVIGQTTSGFEGTWSGYFTTQHDEFWQVEDVSCFAGCTPEYRAALGELLDDPANDARPLSELTGEFGSFMRDQLRAISTLEGLAILDANTPANDPTLLCHPYGFVKEATNPLPMMIRRDGENLVIQYEEWNLSRTIYIDGRSHPANLTPTPLGHSIGRLEGGSLVVDTVGVSADLFYSFMTGGGHSDQVRGTERYTVHDDPRRLVLELTVEDPVMLRAPLRFTKTWLSTPDVELVQDSCEDIPGRP